MALNLTLNSTTMQVNDMGGAEYTIEDIYNIVIGDPTYSATMTKSYDGDYVVYTIVPYSTQTFRLFTLVSGAHIRIPAYTKLVFTKTNANQATVFNVSNGAKLIVQQNVILDMSGNLQDGANAYYYGSINMNGKSDDSRIIITHHKYNYIRPYDEQTWNYVDFTQPIVNASIDLYVIGNEAYTMPVSFTNIRHYTATSHYGTPINFNNGNLINITYQDFQITNKQYIIIASSNAHLKNGVISCPASTYGIQIDSSGKINTQPYNTNKTFNRPIDNRQNYVWLQDITFTDTGTTCAIICTYNSQVYLKNITISKIGSTTRRGVYTYYASSVLLDNVVFNNLLVNITYNTSGIALHVKQQNITILDNNSNPLQYANVSIYSANHEQNWSYLTDINGCIKSTYDTGILLSYKQQYPVNTYTIWCNTADTSTYHYVIASCPGYETYTERIDTNISNDIVIRLTPIKTPIQPGDERMQYLIVEQLKTALQTIPQLNFIGYYPYDYAYIINRLPCVLIKFGNTNVSSPDGLHTYDVVASTQFILYSNLGIEQSLDIEQSIITKIIETLHNNSTYCIIGISDTAVQAGEINEYISPDTTGYNANILVRKIIQSYSFQKII